MKHFENLTLLVKQMPNILRIDLELYHPLGIGKSKRLGRVQEYQNEKFLEKSAVYKYIEYLIENTSIKINI